MSHIMRAARHRREHKHGDEQQRAVDYDRLRAARRYCEQRSDHDHEAAVGGGQRRLEQAAVMGLVDVQRNRATQRMVQDIGAVPERERRARRIEAERRSSHLAEPR